MCFLYSTLQYTRTTLPQTLWHQEWPWDRPEFQPWDISRHPLRELLGQILGHTIKRQENFQLCSILRDQRGVPFARFKEKRALRTTQRHCSVCLLKCVHFSFRTPVPALFCQLLALLSALNPRQALCLEPGSYLVMQGSKIEGKAHCVTEMGRAWDPGGLPLWGFLFCGIIACLLR